MSTAYEDQMHKIADFDKGAFKGRFALMNGQCSGHTSYMAIVTYYHGGVKTTFLNNERIQKMKHVQVGEVLANQKGGVYLKIILSQWYGLDGQGKVVASAEDKKSVGNTDISLSCLKGEMRDAYEVAAGRHRAVSRRNVGGILC